MAEDRFDGVGERFVSVTKSYIAELQSEADERNDLRRLLASYEESTRLAEEAIDHLESKCRQLHMDLRLAIEESEMREDTIRLAQKHKAMAEEDDNEVLFGTIEGHFRDNGAE